MLSVFSTANMRGLWLILFVFFFAACAGLDKTDPKQHNESTSENAVTIYRDNWGVPHIYAQTEQAGYFGLGYAQAEDELTTLLGMTKWAMGEHAELAGVAQLEGDVERRRWQHLAEAREGFKRLSPALQANYIHYIAGIKHYLQRHPDRRPDWLPDLEPAHYIAVARAMFWTGYHDVEGRSECEKARDVSSASNKRQRPYLASNGWVLGPERTAGSVTMLLADPHVGIQTPAYYEYRLHAGELHSAGFSLGPLLWQAHNEYLGWAMTTGSPDLWDCYEVKVDPDNPRRYRFDDKWYEMETREEVFHIAGEDSRSISFDYTRHNNVLSPVVYRKDNKAYVVSLSQMHDAGLMEEEIYRMNLSKNVHELRQAMKRQGMLPQNIIAGDRYGNLFYIRAGKTPRRPGGYDWSAPVPGNTSATQWLGFHPLADNVQVVNPQQGYIQNNNIAPDRMFVDGNLDAADYPAYLFNDPPGRITTRGARALEILAGAKDFTLEDGIALALDEKWITTDNWQAALHSAVTQFPEWSKQQAGSVQDFLDNLLEFDGFAHAESVAALNFYYLRVGAEKLYERYSWMYQHPWEEARFSRTFVKALLNEVKQAAISMQALHGTIDVSLGKVFRVGRGSSTWPLGGTTIRLTPTQHCVASLTSVCDQTQRAFASLAPAENGQRMAFRGTQSLRLMLFGDSVQSFTVHPHGQSDDPQSRHFSDQSRLLSEKRLKPVYFYKEELLPKVTSTTVLNVSQNIK